MTAKLVALLAERLRTGLPHPGDRQNQPPKLLLLPGMSSTGIPPDMARDFAQQAGLPHADMPRLVAEAIMHLLELEGWHLSDQPPPPPAANMPVTMSVYCKCNPRRPLLHAVTDRPIVVDGAMLRAQLEANCRCATSPSASTATPSWTATTANGATHPPS